MGVIADALKTNLRAMAQADARLFRELDQHLGTVNRVAQEMVAEVPAPAIAPSKRAEIAAAISLLVANGYTVTEPGA